MAENILLGEEYVADKVWKGEGKMFRIGRFPACEKKNIIFSQICWLGFLTTLIHLRGLFLSRTVQGAQQWQAENKSYWCNTGVDVISRRNLLSEFRASNEPAPHMWVTSNYERCRRIAATTWRQNPVIVLWDTRVSDVAGQMSKSLHHWQPAFKCWLTMSWVHVSNSYIAVHVQAAWWLGFGFGVGLGFLWLVLRSLQTPLIHLCCYPCLTGRSK